MNKSIFGIVGFGLLLLYSIFVLFQHESPGVILIVSIIGFLVSVGNYLAGAKD